MARLAGFFYILMLPIGMIPMLVGRVPITSDAAATAAAIVAHPAAFYTGFLADILIVAVYIPVTALLYRLFAPVDRALSLTAAFFSLVGCADQAFACLFRVAPMTVLTSVPASRAFSRAAIETLVQFLLNFYKLGYGIALVFFGVYLILIGTLIVRSTFMPRLLGILVMLAGVSGLTFLWPPLSQSLWPRQALCFVIGEGSLVLWLLIRGVDAERWHALARGTAVD